MNSCPDSVGLHLLGVTFKTPLARPLLKVQGSWIWWWHLLFILCLTIILLLSLMLDFCYPYLRDLLLIFTLISYFFLWMSIRIRRLMISLSFLRLSRGLFTTFLSPISSLLILQLCVPQTLLTLDRVRPSFDRSDHGLRSRLLRLLPFQPHLLRLLLLRVVWPLRGSWRSVSAWMLALKHSLLSYIRWTPVLVVLLNNRLAFVAL